FSSVGTAFNVSGPCSLSGIGTATMSANVSFSATSGAITGPFTLTVTGGTITGNVNIPATFLAGAGGNATATITGGTGTYAGASGGFPSLNGSADITKSTLSLSGSGTITASGITGGGGGGGGGTPGPTITDVLDAGSYTPNLAQGGYFVVKGTNMSAS